MKTISSMLLNLSAMFFLALTPSGADAQTSTTNLRFVSFPKSTETDPIELLIGKEKTMEVEIPTNSISKVFEVPTMSSWALGKSAENEEGDFMFEVYGQANAIAAKDQLILVVRKGSKNEDGFKLIPLRIDQQGLGGGSYFLLNASSVDIAGAIGTGEFALKPSRYKLIEPRPTRSSGPRKYAFAKFYYRNKEDVQPFFSSTWRFNENARSLVFFYHDPDTKQLRVHTIRSFVD